MQSKCFLNTGKEQCVLIRLRVLTLQSGKGLPQK
jgi:hypothetical protein